MKKSVKWFSSSTYIPPLSPACRFCAQGAKMVLLVTGKCDACCHYCPLSIKKKGEDVIFADEWKLDNEHETEKIIHEAHLINAKGAGITGGDPLLVLERTCRYIMLLKETFGEKFHIHLYTPNLQNAKTINKLVKSGLDELRLHPHSKNWGMIDKTLFKKHILQVKNHGIDMALEIPVFPNSENKIFSLISWAELHEVDWINLNELEYSEGNYNYLSSLGYRYRSDISSSVEGSEKTADKVMDMCIEKSFNIGVHFCSASFKDSIQLKNRLRRRAKNVSKTFDIITDEGTLLQGVIFTESKLSNVLEVLKKKFEIPAELIEIDIEKSRIHIAPWVLQEVAEDLERMGYDCFLVEEYPTADRLEVEKMKMPLQ